jgi:Flp pilus assembly protein TadG
MSTAAFRTACRLCRPEFLRRFAAARRAATAVEFALLAPLLALACAVLPEPGAGRADSREAPGVASTVGDVAAQAALQAQGG